MKTRQSVILKDVAFARSGDKGDKVNIGLFANDAKAFEIVKRELTTTALKRHFAGLASTAIEVHTMENVMALNIVLSGALPGGGPQSLRVDNLAKTMASALLRMKIERD